MCERRPTFAVTRRKAGQAELFAENAIPNLALSRVSTCANKRKVKTALRSRDRALAHRMVHFTCPTHITAPARPIARATQEHQRNRRNTVSRGKPFHLGTP